MSNRRGFSKRQSLGQFLVLITLMGLLPGGCRTPEPILLEKQKQFLSAAFEAFKMSIDRDRTIPLDPSGDPDLQTLRVSLPSPVNASDIYWRRNLSADDIESRDGEYVIGMIASDTDGDFGFHVFLLYSNGMIVSSATSRQTVDEWAKKLRTQIPF
jgi:hypothetical protein